MKIRELQARQTRVFQSDVLPLTLLATGAVASAFAQRFGFADFQPNTDQGALQSLVFLRGVLPSDEGEELEELTTIHEIRLEPRRISLSVSGRDDEAERAFSALEETICELRPALDKELLVPIVKSVETTCICQLNIDPSRLFSDELRRMAEEDVQPACSSDYGRARLFPARVSFGVKYEPSESVVDAGASLGVKELRLEIRADTQPEDRIFFVRAPIPTQRLTEILESFERAFPDGE